MWPFTKSAKTADLTLVRLHDRVETVERQVRSMLLEWESTYNKLRAVVARLNKRDERAAADNDSPVADATGTTAGFQGDQPAVVGMPRERRIRRNY